MSNVVSNSLYVGTVGAPSSSTHPNKSSVLQIPTPQPPPPPLPPPAPIQPPPHQPLVLSPATATPTLVPANEVNWYRLGSLIYNGILPSMLSVLHNDTNDMAYLGLPRGPTKLYHELTKRKPTIDKLSAKTKGPKVITNDQYDLLYPPNMLTDSQKFDVTLVVILIRNLIVLPPPQSKWDKTPHPNDSSITANILRGQTLRNFFSHHKPDSIDTVTLDNQWIIGERILSDLQYTKCDTKVMRVSILDSRMYAMVKCVTEKERQRIDDLEQRTDDIAQRGNDLELRADYLEQKVDDLGTRTEEVEKIALSLENTAKKLSRRALLNTIHIMGKNSKTLESNACVYAEEKSSVEDNGTSHFHEIRNLSWSIWTHHSKSSNPSHLLDRYQRASFIPQDTKCQLYECGLTRFYKEEEMDEICLNKFHGLFAEDIKNQPWLLTNLHVDCVDNQEFFRFCEKIKSWCVQKSYTFLLLNYSCEDHLKLLNVDLLKLKEYLNIVDLNTSNKQVIVYIAEDGIILSLRFVVVPHAEENYKSNCDKDEVIKKAIIESQNDTKLFSSLHMHLFKDVECTYVSQIVLNDITDEELDDFIGCKPCKKDLVITKDNLSNEMHLNRRLDKIIQKKVDVFKRMNRTDSLFNTPVESVFEKMAARIWSCLCLKEVCLSNISVCGLNNTLARLYLKGK